MLPAQRFFDTDAHCVEPWNVKGIKLGIDGKLYAIDGSGEDYEIGSDLCCLTRAEAEAYLLKKKMEGK